MLALREAVGVLPRTAALWLSLLSALGLCAPAPEPLAPYVPFEQHPDLFFEVTSEQAGWGTTTGWVHWHWAGGWEASGEATLTTLWAISTFADPDLRLPPVLEEMRLRLDASGLALVRRRAITAELPDEVVDFPAGSWLLPLPIEAGRTWTTEQGATRTWGQIVSAEAESPNPLFTGAPCVVTLAVAAERRSSGIVVVDVTRTWWAPGVGPVFMEQAHGAPEGLDWEQLAPEALGALAERAGELRQRATLRLVPFPDLQPHPSGGSPGGAPLSPMP